MHEFHIFRDMSHFRHISLLVWPWPGPWARAVGGAGLRPWPGRGPGRGRAVAALACRAGWGVGGFVWGVLRVWVWCLFWLRVGLRVHSGVARVISIVWGGDNLPTHFQVLRYG